MPRYIPPNIRPYVKLVKNLCILKQYPTHCDDDIVKIIKTLIHHQSIYFYAYPFLDQTLIENNEIYFHLKKKYNNITLDKLKSMNQTELTILSHSFDQPKHWKKWVEPLKKFTVNGPILLPTLHSLIALNKKLPRKLRYYSCKYIIMFFKSFSHAHPSLVNAIKKKCQQFICKYTISDTPHWFLNYIQQVQDQLEKKYCKK